MLENPIQRIGLAIRVVSSIHMLVVTNIFDHGFVILGLPSEVYALGGGVGEAELPPASVPMFLP